MVSSYANLLEQKKVFTKENGSTPTRLVWDTNMATISLFWVAYVANVSVRFRGKERGKRVKDHAKNGASKRAGRGWGIKEGRKEGSPPLPPLSFFGSRSIFRAAKPSSFLGLSLLNAYYAGYLLGYQ